MASTHEQDMEWLEKNYPEVMYGPSDSTKSFPIWTGEGTAGKSVLSKMNTETIHWLNTLYGYQTY